MTRDSRSSRVALITGAGSGIGRATAHRLAADGYRVALLGRRRNALDETATEVGGTDRAMVLPCDVTDVAAVRAAVATVLDTFGRIDVLVNNAGISATAPFAEVTLDHGDRSWPSMSKPSSLSPRPHCRPCSTTGAAS
jgi:meso-butanediol dehydrogenase / (S,S)-butanediol dehydrogenase / diacetyl reductase